MIDAFIFSLNAVFPLVLVSAFGFYLRQNGTFSDEFLRIGNKFVFKYGFFAMLFMNVYKIESFDVIQWHLILATVVAVLVLFLIGLVYIIFFVKDPKQKGVVHQAFYRSNYATIGLPLAFNIAGPEGLMMASLVSAFSVPLYNVLAVISLSAFNTDRKRKDLFFHILKSIATNPLILGVVAGLIAIGIRPFCGEWRLSTGSLSFLYKSIDAVATIAPWFSLIILGGQFKFSAVKRLLPQITVSVLARLVLAPIVGMAISFCVAKICTGHLFSAPENAALFALFATSEAVASVAMADQMNGDYELAGQILVWTTLFSAFSLFLFVAFFRSIGIF